MSKMSREADFERIEDEASIWAARLRGGAMTDADRAALAAWLDRNPEHRWVLARYHELSAQLDAQFGAAAEATPITKRDAARRRWRRFTVMTAAAAALVMLAVVLTGPSREFETKTAERHLAALTDGSRVELNARTALAVDFRREERHVRLIRGEALFNVTKDPARPFVIDTPAGTVRVTGTVFDVRATSGDRVEVTVLEGTVQVHAAQDTSTASTSAGAPMAPMHDAAITPGRQAVMSGGNVDLRTLPGGAVQNVTAWRQGQVVFEDTPLSEALERFAAYDQRKITVEPGAADLRLGGRYGLDDLDGLLTAVERVLPVRVLRGADGTVRIIVASAPMK